MKYSAKNGAKWLAIYVLLVMIPFLCAISGSLPEYRGPVIEFGVALGFVGMGMLAVQFLFSGRIREVAPKFGMDNILQYHREMGILALLFLLMHPAILIFVQPEFGEYFNPQVNLPRAIALSSATIGLVILAFSSLYRAIIGLSYELWRLIHGTLSALILIVGIAHSIQVGHYLNATWQKMAIITTMGLAIYFVIHTRIVRPWVNRKRPYVIRNIIAERDDCWTIELTPQGHQGMKYKCGQFVWITIGSTPFKMQQHPFSIASACTGSTIKLTAKNSGDFTSTWKNLKPETTAYLEGPFGSFTPEPEKHMFMVMGGIGITPGIGMLRTLEQQNSSKEVILLYANPDWENITFREELERLRTVVNLQLIHVLQELPQNPQSNIEKGLIDYEIIKKHAPANLNDFAFYICGPKPMMDAAELAVRDLGADWRYVYSERFNII
ncbi:ferredoxin reductase family protein [Natronoflexus pectinivorans]|uniref:Putative ferric reductase n=1 Tax=Natronoflexus pectinivorans TaxID=682526 RepID=A0A4R2GNC1_9BACT|nr:ferric reductase-like transmembrane domain-containing protein [Natronoflexus pectinivorans]TCO10498.1 putative ferric reductase [Natronoflexus pectinivorans]